MRGSVVNFVALFYCFHVLNFLNFFNHWYILSFFYWREVFDDLLGGIGVGGECHYSNYFLDHSPEPFWATLRPSIASDNKIATICEKVRFSASASPTISFIVSFSTVGCIWVFSAILSL